MYYATQTNLPGAPGNLAAYTPQPAYQQQMQGFTNNSNVIVATPSAPVVVSYGQPTDVGNMGGMAKVGVW